MKFDPNQPRIVAFDDLLKSLSKFFDVSSPEKNRGMVHDLHDLWKMGAPTPDSGPGVVEKRILFPQQFADWWQLMAERHGMSNEIQFSANSYRPTDKAGNQ
jgi:hypothetical protein